MLRYQKSISTKVQASPKVQTARSEFFRDRGQALTPAWPTLSAGLGLPWSLECLQNKVEDGTETGRRNRGHPQASHGQHAVCGSQIFSHLFPSMLLQGPQALRDPALPTSPPSFCAVRFSHAALFFHSWIAYVFPGRNTETKPVILTGRN